MSKQAYNDQTMIRYLLGALPEAEAERLDELSFTDDEFAGALRAAENDLVDAYARGELTSATLEQFKTHYLASPLRREKAEFAQAFRLLAERGAAARAAEARTEAHGKSVKWGRGSGWFSALSARPALQWGTALAVLALAVAGSWLVRENARLRGQVSQTQASRDALHERERELERELVDERSAGAQVARELARLREERERVGQEREREGAPAQRGAAGQRPATPGGGSIASFVLTPQMRGAGHLQTINIPAEAAHVTMQVELEPNDYSAYRVALVEQSRDHTIWRSRQLRARSAGEGQSVGVSFPSGLLRPRIYVLRVTGLSAGGTSEIIGDYPFRVVK